MTTRQKRITDARNRLSRILKRWHRGEVSIGLVYSAEAYYLRLKNGV